MSLRQLRNSMSKARKERPNGPPLHLPFILSGSNKILRRNSFVARIPDLILIQPNALPFPSLLGKGPGDGVVVVPKNWTPSKESTLDAQ